MCICVYIISKRKQFPVIPRMPWKLRLKYFWKAIPSLLTIVIIIGGIWSGLFTATEAAIVASVYALFVACVIHKELKMKDVGKIIYDSLITSCKTLFIIAVANFLAYFMLHQHIPNQVIEGLMSITASPVILTLLMVFVLLVLGMFMEGISVILITTPIFLPIVDAIGMNYIQFGVIMVLASMIGLLTPHEPLRGVEHHERQADGVVQGGTALCCRYTRRASHLRLLAAAVHLAAVADIGGCRDESYQKSR